MQLRATLAGLAMAVSAATAVPMSPSAVPIKFVPSQLHYETFNLPARFNAQSSRKALKGQYMVMLKPGADVQTFLLHRQTIAAAQATADAHLADAEERGIRHIYDLDGHMQGYSGKFSDDVLAYIRAHPEVDYVEQDTVVTTMEMPDDGSNVWDVGYDVKIEDAFSAMGAPELSKQSLEKGAPWGLVRVSHRDAVSFKNFGQYVYQGQGGEGVTAYVIDTGINIDHVEFEGRATWGKTMPANDEDKDGNGHGTHCAGTIASRKYGVAKKADLVAVKVLSSSGSGSMSDVTGGVLWAVEDAKKKTQAMAANPSSAAAKKHRGFVANMSLGGGKSPTLDRAVNGAVASGMHFGVAAGNENQDACNVSPAGASNPVTVGAMTLADVGASFSNWGKCVDVFAPGLNILSTWNSGNQSTNTISGTSMASPHVVGMLAYLLSIYGSEEFDAVESSLSGGLPFGRAQGLDMTDFSDSVASKLHSVMPFSSLAFDFVSGLFGGKKQVKSSMAPVPKEPDVASVLHPAELKKALIKLSTSGKLNDIGQDSPNYLIFNNATLTK